MALEINQKNFESLIKEDKLIVIDFWAQWCGPCRALGPTIEEVAAEYEGKAIIGKCDTEANDELAVQFGVRSIPMLVFIKNGKVVDTNIGMIKKNELTKKIDALI